MKKVILVSEGIFSSNEVALVTKNKGELKRMSSPSMKDKIGSDGEIFECDFFTVRE